MTINKTCARCGKINRYAKSKVTEKSSPVCGNCGTFLEDPQPTKNTTFFRKIELRDIRAHQVFFWISFPVNLCFFFVSALSFIIVLHTVDGWNFSALKKILATTLIFEIAVGLVLFILHSITLFFLRSVFFWFVKLTPSESITSDEMEDIFKVGEKGVLFKKLLTDVGNFSLGDQRRLEGAANWQARLFFGERTKNRFQFLLQAYRESFRASGKQLADLSKSEADRINQLPDSLKESFLEKVINNPNYFYSAVRFLITILFFN